MLSGSCQIQADSFIRSRCWPEVCQTQARSSTISGYRTALLGMPECAEERSHTIRFGLWRRVEPQLHGVFERRFGFPYRRCAGMTEMYAMLDHEPPRSIGTARSPADTRAISA